MKESPLLTRAEAAAYLRVSLRHFAQRIQPELRAIRSGRLVRFKHEDIEAWSRRESHIPKRSRGGRKCEGPKLRNRDGYYSVRFTHARRTHEFALGRMPEEAAEEAAAKLYERYVSPPDPFCPGVYIMAAGAHFKVGRSSTSVYRRLRNIQTDQAHEVLFMGMVSSDPADEARAQDALRAFHVRGEWYELTPQAQRAISLLLERGLP